MKRSILVMVVILSVANVSSAITVRGIDIDFVTIGNAGNTADTTGYGAVGYDYRIGKYEITNGQWDTFVSLAGAPTGSRSAYNESSHFDGANVPTGNVSWFEAAQFCNYLTSGDKSKGAYLWSGDNTNPGSFLDVDRDSSISTYGTTYVIPTEDEWYKAAYYTGSGYSLYANGQSTIPAADYGWNYTGGAYDSPWDVGTGTQEQNGTFDMMGNFWEWNETEIGSNRGRRGGSYHFSDYHGYYLRSSYRDNSNPSNEGDSRGFRVASVPEPTTLLLLGLGGLMLRRKR